MAMADLVVIHKKYWITATREEFQEYRRENPSYDGGRPLFVRDLIGQMRWALSTYGEAKAQEKLDLPEEYFDALHEYVRLFPTDTPHPGELPSASN